MPSENVLGVETEEHAQERGVLQGREGQGNGALGTAGLKVANAAPMRRERVVSPRARCQPWESHATELHPPTKEGRTSLPLSP